MGSTFIAYLTCFLAFLYLEFTDPAYNEGGKFTGVIMAFSFLIGLQVCQIVVTPLGSGVDTLFVGMGWDGDVLAREHRDFWDRLVATDSRVGNLVGGGHAV